MAEEKKGKKAPSKSKHKKVQIWKKYKDGKATGKWCPRCGAGFFLGIHKNRCTCGKCHYSETQMK